MLKFLRKNLTYNWFNHLCLFLISLVICTILGSFSLIFTNVLYYVNYHKHLEETIRLQMISSSGSLLGIVVFMSSLALYSSLTLSVALKKDQIFTLFNLGYSFKKIKSQLSFENIIIILLACAFSLWLSHYVSEVIVYFLKIKNFYNEGFELIYFYKWQFIYLLYAFLLTSAISFYINAKLTTIQSKRTKNKKVSKIVWSLILLILIFGIVFNPWTMVDGIGQNLILIALMLWIIFLINLGDIVLFKVIDIFTRWFKISNKMQVFNVLKYHKTAGYKILLVMISMFCFINYATSSTLIGKTDQTNVTNVNILVILVTSFHVLILVNMLLQYFMARKSEFKTLLNLGCKGRWLIWQIIQEYLVFLVIAILLAVIPIFIMNLSFSLFNHTKLIILSNFKTSLLANLSLFLGLFILLIPELIIIKNIKR